MIRNEATKKMISALSVLELSNLIWTKRNNVYFWGTEDGNPTSVFLKTIKSLENKGYAAIVHQMDRISVNITESGKKFLSECRREDQKEELLKKMQELESATILDSSHTDSSEMVECTEPLVVEEEERPDFPSVPVPIQTEVFPKQTLQDEEVFGEEKQDDNKICVKQTVYLIDSENVGNTWLGLISRLREDDELHVFYTDKSPTLTYETVVRLLEHDYIGVVNWIKCFTGENALDFQLVTELGSMIAEKGINGIYDPYFIILSRDRGYDPVVSYWTKKGVMIKRYPSYTDIRDALNRPGGILEDDFANVDVEEDKMDQEQQNKNEHRHIKREQFQSYPAANSVFGESKKVIRGKKAVAAIDGLLKEKTWKEKLEDFFSEKVQMNDPKAAAEYLIEVSRLISVNNEEKYLRAITTQFGEQNGAVIMGEIQCNKFLRLNLSNGTIKNMKIRRKDYIMLFLRNNDFLDPDIRSIAPLLQKPSRVPMENVKRLLLRYHNGTETQTLINLIQKHLKVVKEIV